MYNTSDKLFLIAAFGSFLFSIALWFGVSQEYGLFVGLWVPSVLGLWCGVNLVVLRRNRI